MKIYSGTQPWCTFYSHFIAIPNDTGLVTRFDTSFKQTEVAVLSYWWPLHALWRPPERNVCSGRNNSTRSERTQTRLSRRLHKRWYRVVIYRGRRVGERERGSRMKKLTTTATKGRRGMVGTSEERVNGSTVRQMARWRRRISTPHCLRRFDSVAVS